jgi:hypothetical protein
MMSKMELGVPSVLDFYQQAEQGRGLQITAAMGRSLLDSMASNLASNQSETRATFSPPPAGDLSRWIQVRPHCLGDSAR